jgi:hypothetical protein
LKLGKLKKIEMVDAWTQTSDRSNKGRNNSSGVQGSKTDGSVTTTDKITTESSESTAKKRPPSLQTGAADEPAGQTAALDQTQKSVIQMQDSG